MNISRKRFRLVSLIFSALIFFSCGFYNRFEQPPAVYNTPLQTIYLLKEENKQYENLKSRGEAYHAPEIKNILDRGFIVFAMTARDYKPFYYADRATGEFIGLDVELAYSIANRLGVKAAFNRDSSTPDEVISAVINKKADVALSRINFTMRRAEKVRFTVPYISFRHALLINRLEYAKIGTERELPAFIRNFRGNMGVIADSPYQNSAPVNFPHADMKTYDSWERITDDLFKGRLLAAYRDEEEILIAHSEINDAYLLLKPVFIGDKREQIAMAVSADAVLLQEWLNIFIGDFLTQGLNELTPNTLIERHFGGER